jgi:DNA-binding NtrC family response regulator
MSQEEIAAQRLIKILAIDDDETVLKLYQRLLADLGHPVVVARTGAQALEIINKENVDLVILDLKLPDVHGCELLGQIKEKLNNAPVIIVTAHPTLESSIESIRAGGVYDYIIKPFASDALQLVVRRAVERTILMSENKRLMHRLEVAHQALGERVEQLEKIAGTALGYEGTIAQLQERIKQLEEKK